MNTPKERAKMKSLHWCDVVGRSVMRDPETEPRGHFGGSVPEVGEMRSFVPAAFTDCTTLKPLPSLQGKGLTVTGTVVQVHEAHRWCRVEYLLDGCGLCYECFKF